MFKIIYNVVIYISLIFSFYYIIIALFSFFKKKKVVKIKKDNYFAILVAARNEEEVIGALIDSLKNQNYDKSLYEINIIINNCTDDTEKIAKAKKVNIIKCDKKTTCKADALKIAFEKLKSNKKIDAYLIFDADNVVHPDFLKHMNISLNEGYQIAQGMREAKNIGQNWISSSYAIYFYLQNYFLSRPRKNIKISTFINGTGFMVKKEVIDRLGFNMTTLTEDVEFSGLCILNKMKIDYVEDAITYDEHPTNFVVSWNQRMRWTRGSLDCLRKYGLKLIKNFFKTFNISNIDLLFLYFAPIVQISSFTVILVDILINIFTLDFNIFVKNYLFNGIISLAVSYLLTFIVSTYVVIHYKHKVKQALSGIIFFALFIFTWIPINIVSIFKPKLTWKPIKHDSKISIDELIKK